MNSEAILVSTVYSQPLVTLLERLVVAHERANELEAAEQERRVALERMLVAKVDEVFAVLAMKVAQ